LGRGEEAVECYMKALELKPESEYSKKLRENLGLEEPAPKKEPPKPELKEEFKEEKKEEEILEMEEVKEEEEVIEFEEVEEEKK
ncbi:MAG: hypothetical protein AB1779_00745, partial [Candidatus Thermoplasmatota archaeon]